MASQTGSIDLTASNSVKLAAEAGWQSDLDDYYTKSEIDVTVGGINSEVSKKVNGTEVISSINQSAESVSINANKINLTGAVTIGDLASATQDAVLNSNVQVGGRNLLRGSYSGDGWVNYTTLEDGVFTRRTTSTSETYILSGNATSGSTQYLMLDLNTTYTLSCWAKSNGFVKSMDMYCYDQSTKNIKTRTGIALTTDWVKYEFTFTTPTEWQSGSSPTGFLCRFDNNGSTTSGTAAILYVKWPMLERGNKATDWSPAPEDVDSAISDAAKTATSYVTNIDSNGITIHPSRSDYATNGGRAVINGDGLTVYVGSDDVASYGASARIGKSNSDRVTVDSTNGITIYKGNSKRLQTTANGIDVYGSDGTTSIASFGATARIGKSNGTRVTIDTSEVKIIPSNKTNSALTFSATDDSARIDYGNGYLSIGDLLLGYDCALDVMGNTWISSGGLHVGGSASSGDYKAQVTSAGTVRASGAIYATDDPTDTSDPSLVAGLVGTGSFIVLRADEGSTGNRWRFNKAGRDIGYYNGTDWDTVCPMPAMTAAISGETDKSLTTSYANLNLAAVTTVASALTISGGGVKCTKAGRVMISGAAYFEDVNAGNVCNLRVLIGSTVAAFVSDRAYSDRCQMVIPPRITTVAAGDVLYMAVANTSAATGHVEGIRTQTWLTVQYVAYN